MSDVGMADHAHVLAECHECDGYGCDACDGRGYFEFCLICGRPMGNKGRAWKRSQPKQ